MSFFEKGKDFGDIALKIGGCEHNGLNLIFLMQKSVMLKFFIL